MSLSPLIFIHYGPASYLRIVLRAAQRSNPGRAIYFLGDDTNRRFVPVGVTYFPLAEFRRGSLLEQFSKVFVPIAGSAHHYTKEGGTETWLKFVFERWFIIREFLQDRGVDSFWTFDSDTLIAGDLAARQSRFVVYDATEQCCGGCLNGWISSRSVVDGYCEKMVELYCRPPYLEAQRERLQSQPRQAFNEMDAWQTFRDEAKLKTLAIGKPHEGEAFDDALAFTAGWQTSTTQLRRGQFVKKIARDRRGGFFGFTENEGNPVRFVTLNMSWMPDYLFRQLSLGCGPVGVLDYKADECREINYAEPILDWVRKKIEEGVWNIRSRFR